jgi:hypothetical protein
MKRQHERPNGVAMSQVPRRARYDAHFLSPVLTAIRPTDRGRDAAALLGEARNKILAPEGPSVNGSETTAKIRPHGFSMTLVTRG